MFYWEAVVVLKDVESAYSIRKYDFNTLAIFSVFIIILLSCSRATCSDMYYSSYNMHNRNFFFDYTALCGNKVKRSMIS